jgi:hypothetical protein
MQARPTIVSSGLLMAPTNDCASWYADWLISLSELPDLLGIKPVRSELVYLLVSLDKEYTASHPGRAPGSVLRPADSRLFPAAADAARAGKDSSKPSRAHLFRPPTGPYGTSKDHSSLLTPTRAGASLPLRSAVAVAPPRQPRTCQILCARSECGRYWSGACFAFIVRVLDDS